MRWRRLLSIIPILVFAYLACAGSAYDLSQSSLVREQPERFDFSIESAYLLGIFGNPHSYEVNANFLTARMRWGDFTERPGIFRGYNQVYLSAEAEPITRGIENHYFGINIGLRYSFGRADSRLRPYFSGGLGLGFIDSNADNFGSQGQDFTFNILSAAGISYKFNERLNGQLGLLYEHFSNAGQTDPNPSLNLLGPQLGFTYSF
jgi:Lipid A 3-O-deacylase (PagL)